MNYVRSELDAFRNLARRVLQIRGTYADVPGGLIAGIEQLTIAEGHWGLTVREDYAPYELVYGADPQGRPTNFNIELVRVYTKRLQRALPLDALDLA